MFTIFEEQWDERYYVKMESDFESELAFANVSSVLLIESLQFSSPLYVMRLIDGLGDLITHNRISPSDPYNLIIGSNSENTTHSEFLLSKNAFENMQYGKTENILCEAYFISSKWDALFRRVHNRSWKDVKYSDVVEELCNEIGFESVDIEPTEGVFTVIQPHWTNYQLLKWIAERCVSASTGNTGYEIGVRFDGSFFFKTLDSLMASSPVKTLYLSGREVIDNQFFDLKIEQDYASNIKQGAGGFTYNWFDYDNKKYMRGQKTVEDLDQRQLSDWMFITEAHNTAENYIYGGRDGDTESVVESRLTSVSNSIQKIKIPVRGDISVRMGDVIEIQIQPTEHSQLLVNEFYSGRYLVSRVQHELLFNDHDFITELTLIRQGMDGKDIDGFVKTAKGKSFR